LPIVSDIGVTVVPTIAWVESSTPHARYANALSVKAAAFDSADRYSPISFGLSLFRLNSTHSVSFASLHNSRTTLARYSGDRVALTLPRDCTHVPSRGSQILHQ